MGQPNVDAMLASISNIQFEEWIAYFEIEPFGDAWLRTAMLASLIANANRNTDEKPEPFTAQDFMPVQMEEPETEEDPDMSWKRNKEILSMMAMKKTSTPPLAPPHLITNGEGDEI